MPIAVRADDEESNSEVKEPPKSSCATYVAEGDKLFRKNELRKAIESYTQALQQAEVEEVDKKQSYYSRALCYLYLGDSESALSDAEEALELDPTYTKGLLIKAESLYRMGDFEYALLFYHRGYQARSDCADFKIGIQKSQEAIENAIGEDGCDITTEGDLSMYYNRDLTSNYITFSANRAKGKKGGAQKQETKKKEDSKSKKEKMSSKNSRRLLGEIYADKEFLEQIFKDDVLADKETDSGKKIYQYTSDVLEYLEKREEFWHQQNPSRLKSKQQQRTSSGRACTSAQLKKNEPGRYMHIQLEKIDADYLNKKYRPAEKRCRELIEEIKSYNETDLSNKKELLALVHSLMGQCLFDQGKYEQAEKQHQRDFDISDSQDSFEGKSRALDNLGRVWLKLDNLDKAVQYWESKLQLLQQQPRGGTAQSGASNKDRAKTAKDLALEKTWLYHEIGRCHLKSSKNSEAKEYGERALASAKQSEDKNWELNALGLIGKAEAQMEEYQAASDSFEKALELAKEIQNKEAQKALESALKEVNNKIVRGVKTEEAVEDEGPSSDQRREKERKQKEKEEHEKKKEREKEKEEKEKEEKEKEKKEKSDDEGSANQSDRSHKSHKSNKSDKK